MPNRRTTALFCWYTVAGVVSCAALAGAIGFMPKASTRTVKNSSPLVFEATQTSVARLLIGTDNMIEFRMPFRNTSSQLVKIVHVRCCCGTSVAEPVEKEIAAGAGGELKGTIRLVPEQKSGVVSSSVRVLYEHLGKRREAEASIQVVAHRLLEADVEYIDREWASSESVYEIEIVQTRLAGGTFAEPTIRIQEPNLHAKFVGEWQPMNSTEEFSFRRRKLQIAAPVGPAGGFIQIVDSNGVQPGCCTVRVDLKETRPFKTSHDVIVLSEKNGFKSSLRIESSLSLIEVKLPAGKESLKTFVATVRSEDKQRAMIELRWDESEPTKALQLMLPYVVVADGKTYSAELPILVRPRIRASSSN